MNVNSSSVGQEKINNSNGIDEAMSLPLRLDHEVPVEHTIQPTPVTTNKENNQNQLNNVSQTSGRQKNKPVANGSTETKEAGPSAQTKLTSKTFPCNTVSDRAFRVAEEYRLRREMRMKKNIIFALKMVDRLKERKQWNEKYEQELKLRKEKEQQEKEEKEARERMLFRKQTDFKAKPNPFKKS